MVLESVLKRDRLIVLTSVLVVTALAWLYLSDMALDMARISDRAGEMMAMTKAAPWTLQSATMTFLMWAIMMVGMMLPSAAPMILIFATINRKKREGDKPYTSTGAFAAGYVLVWAAFSVAATAAQWALQSVTLVSPVMVSTSAYLGGALFIAAGIYQFTPLKHACLKHCRSPLHFVLHHWRTGAGGALRMGIEHGAYCTGCCWLIMALLFVLGVMNLAWVGALAVFVLAEKVMPRGEWFARASGVAMMAFGIYLVMRG